MDFMDDIFLGNTIRSYLLVSGTILLVLIIKRYVSRYIASLCYRLIHRVWKNVRKQSFIELVVSPLKWFLLILISVFAIDKLNFPEQFHYIIYGHSTEEIFDKLGTGIIIISFTWLVLRLVDFIALVLEEKANRTPDDRDNQLIVFFRDFLKVIIGICGVLLIVKACFNQPIGSLLTGLSIVGAAMALAGKESLENLIASFIIFFDKPFFTGDTVKVNNITGKVEHIGLRSTRIRTADKTLVTVPNKQMVDSMVDNWSMRTRRRAEIKLELSAKTGSNTIEEVCNALKKLLAENTPPVISGSVYLKEVSKNGSIIVAEYYTDPFSLEEFDALKEKINFGIKKILEMASVDFAGESNTIVISNDVRESE